MTFCTSLLVVAAGAVGLLLLQALYASHGWNAVLLVFGVALAGTILHTAWPKRG